MLSRGLPRRHHIVTYLLLLSTEPHQRLEVSDGDNVPLCPWGDPSPERRVGDNVPVCPLV